MTTPLFRPLKRMRDKAFGPPAIGVEVQDHLPGEILEEIMRSKRQVYLLTCPHPTQDRAANGTPLRAPNTYRPQDFLGSLLDSCA